MMKRGLSLLFLLFAITQAQTGNLTIPSWLTPYPGATPSRATANSDLAESAYAASAVPDAVVTHYRTLFEKAGVTPQTNFDGVGTTIRGSAPECDLLISVRGEDNRANVRVTCAKKSENGGPREIISDRPSYGRHMSASSAGMDSPRSANDIRNEIRQRMADNQAAMRRREANRAAGKPFDAVWTPGPENDAPALAWPAWLAHVQGQRLTIQKGVDQSEKSFLEASYTTSAPMTEIYKFYESALKANGYPVYSAKLGTGQTMSGVSQNANGYVEGAFHAYDANGPRTVIRVSFSRFYLNEPIKVHIRMTAYPRF